ncbi:MAG TPA: hypothetical protein VLC74_11515 [Rhizomicrobium sp.]|nr:hypothetical protein [Rhizomicrobium sp.]
MHKTALLAAAAALALSAGSGTLAAERHINPTSAGSHTRAKVVISGASKTLYDQNSNDAGSGPVSQNFESTFDAYDSQAADDFIVPSGQKWVITEVDVTGVYFNGPGPAASENVFFYKDKGGLPGVIVGQCPAVAGTDSAGSFVINCRKRLRPGHYWVSVQVNMDFASGGEWAWEGNLEQHGNPAAWENPGNGFGTGCTNYEYKILCGLEAPTTNTGADQMFAIKGKVRT